LIGDCQHGRISPTRHHAASLDPKFLKVSQHQKMQVTQIGVDETAMAKGHPYRPVVCDLEEVTVEYSGARAQGRKPGRLLQGLRDGPLRRDRGDQPGHVARLPQRLPGLCAGGGLFPLWRSSPVSGPDDP
jgi:hypothetical protein